MKFPPLLYHFYGLPYCSFFASQFFFCIFVLDLYPAIDALGIDKKLFFFNESNENKKWFEDVDRDHKAIGCQARKQTKSLCFRVVDGYSIIGWRTVFIKHISYIDVL